MEEIEVKVFGKRARIVLCITLVIFGVICALGLTEMVKTMAISVVDILLFAVMGKIKLLNYKRKKIEQN